MQTCVTCLVLGIATISYIAMQLWPLPDFMYVLSQVTWQAINGIYCSNYYFPLSQCYHLSKKQLSMTERDVWEEGRGRRRRDRKAQIIPRREQNNVAGSMYR